MGNKKTLHGRRRPAKRPAPKPALAALRVVRAAATAAGPYAPGAAPAPLPHFASGLFAAQFSHGLSLARPLLAAAYTAAASLTSLRSAGYLVIPGVIHPHLLRLIEASSLSRSRGQDRPLTAQGRVRCALPCRLAVALPALDLLYDAMAAMGFPARELEPVYEGRRRYSLQLEGLLVHRGMPGSPASTQQPLHTDFCEQRLTQAECGGGERMGMALSMLLPATSAASGSYVAGSHLRGPGSEAGLPLPVAVHVPAGAVLVFHPQLAHFGGSGAALPPGVSQRAALFMSASHPQAYSGRVPSRSLVLGGQRRQVVHFGGAGYNNALR